MTEPDGGMQDMTWNEWRAIVLGNTSRKHGVQNISRGF